MTTATIFQVPPTPGIGWVRASFWAAQAEAKGRRRRELAAMDPEAAQALASAAPAAGTTRLVMPAGVALGRGLVDHGEDDPAGAD